MTMILTPADRDALFTRNQRLAFWVAQRLWDRPEFRERAEPAGHTFDDVKSAALAGLWNAAQRFDPARGVKFSGHAAVVARHVALKLLKCSPTNKRQRRMLSLYSDDDGDAFICEPADHREPAPDRAALARIELANVLAAMNGLVPRSREFLMRLARGKNRAAIARTVGISLEAVCQQVIRGRKQLHQELDRRAA